jgi:hypothetical protein
MYSVQDLPKGGVAPFGHPRINDRSHLPAAFRSVPRPSSPLGAKASTERPSHTQLSTARTQDPSAPLTRHFKTPHVQSDSSNTENTHLIRFVSRTSLHSISPNLLHHEKQQRNPRRQDLRPNNKVVFRKLRNRATARPRIHNLHLEAIGFEPMTPCLQSRCSTN